MKSRNLAKKMVFFSFIHLPEEIVLQIFSKLMDLKTLCLCKLVSKRFYRIVLQVETISYTFSTDALVDPPDLGPYGSAIESLMEFENVKSICIQLPSSFEDPPFFKWKFNFEPRQCSFLFLSPNSIFHKKQTHVNENGQEEEEEEDDDEEEEEDMKLTRKKFEIVGLCLKDAVMRVNLLVHMSHLPLLEKISITDSRNRGEVSLSGGKVAELSNWLSSLNNESIQQKLKYLFTGCRSSDCYVPLLKLPLSGYVMKGVYLYLMEWNDLPHDNYKSFMKSQDDLEDKEEAAFSEALMEIFKKHSSQMRRLI